MVARAPKLRRLSLLRAQSERARDRAVRASGDSTPELVSNPPCDSIFPAVFLSHHLCMRASLAMQPLFPFPSRHSEASNGIGQAQRPRSSFWLCVRKKIAYQSPSVKRFGRFLFNKVRCASEGVS